MKQSSILRRILLPAAIFLLLLPPISYLIFQRAAQEYALALAQRDLRGLQSQVLPLIDEYFGDPQDDATDAKQSREFLARVKPLLKGRIGGADMLILNYRFEIVYPRDEEELAQVRPLADACAGIILSGQGTPVTGIRSVSAGEDDGQTFLVDFFEVQSEAHLRAKYLLTYSPVMQIGSWISGASRLMLLISAGFALLTLGMLWMTARSISQPIHRLCREAERIGGGDFAEIQPAFALAEPEELRLAMNAMSRRLMHAEDAQRDFFQNVSHELRTPLMSIGGYAQGIERGVFARPEEAARTILDESARLTELVNSLLTLSRLESGANPPQLAPVRIDGPIEDSLDRVSGLALESGIALSLEEFDRSLAARGDEDLIAKVLENLLTNAIRYAKSRVVTAVAAQDGRLALSVTDDGEGIAAQDLPHLFERCYKGRGGNFGIGLAIAKSAAVNMGGSLTAENLPGGGARFTLTLQRAL